MAIRTYVCIHMCINEHALQVTTDILPFLEDEGVSVNSAASFKEPFRGDARKMDPHLRNLSQRLHVDSWYIHGP